MTVRAAAAVSHFASPPIRVQTPVTEGDKTDRLYLRKKESSRCKRRRLYSLWTGNMLLSWRDDHSSSASPLPRMLTFISSIRCNSSVNQPMFRETERAAKSPAAPIYSMSFSHSSPGVWSHPPPSLHLILNILLSSFVPPFISFPLVLTHCCERRCMIYEALFLPVTEEKERREAATKARERKRGRRMEGRVWRASPRGRRTGECEGNIHHPATPRLKMKTPSRMRQKYDGFDQD